MLSGKARPVSLGDVVGEIDGPGQALERLEGGEVVLGLQVADAAVGRPLVRG